MNLMIKSMLLLTMISMPTIDAVSSDRAWSKAVGFVHQVTTSSTSVRAKDETRLAPVAR